MLRERALTRALVTRAERLLRGRRAATFECPTATRYAPGGRFATHNDASLAPGEW